MAGVEEVENMKGMEVMTGIKGMKNDVSHFLHPRIGGG
jgi:hypothetical protein